MQSVLHIHIPNLLHVARVEEQMLKEACARAERRILKDEKLLKILAGKEFEAEIGGSYLPEEPEKLRIGATIRFDREYSFKVDGKNRRNRTPFGGNLSGK